MIGEGGLRGAFEGWDRKNSVGPVEEQSHWFHRFRNRETAVPLVSASLIRSVFRRTDLPLEVASQSPNEERTYTGFGQG